MRKLKIKRGFTLIEVLCSISIYSIIFLATISIGINVINLKSYNDTMIKYCSFIEGLKYNIKYNMNLEDIQNIISRKRFFINKENINIDKLKQKNIAALLSNKKESDTYIEISIQSEEFNRKYKVDIYLNSKIINKRQKLKCNFYKEMNI